MEAITLPSPWVLILTVVPSWCYFAVYPTLLLMYTDILLANPRDDHFLVSNALGS